MFTHLQNLMWYDGPLLDLYTWKSSKLCVLLRTSLCAKDFSFHELALYGLNLESDFEYCLGCVVSAQDVTNIQNGKPLTPIMMASTEKFIAFILANNKILTSPLPITQNGEFPEKLLPPPDFRLP